MADPVRIRDILHARREVPFYNQIDLLAVEDDVVIGASGNLTVGFRLEGMNLMLKSRQEILSTVEFLRRTLGHLPEKTQYQFILKHKSGAGRALYEYRDLVKGEDLLSEALVEGKFSALRKESLFNDDLYLFITKFNQDNQKIGGKEVIVVEVKESHDHLVLADGRPYKRVGRSTVKMSKDEYERLIFEKHKDKLQFDEMVCKGALMKDIDAAKVFWFLDKAKEEKRLIVPSKTTMKDVFVRLNLFVRGKLTNTAILLFGREPQKFFVQAKIRVARFKGVEGHDYLDTKVLEGTISELREKALSFIAEHTRHAVFFDANQRFDKWEYPFRALEEVLNNALVHRDYRSNSDIHLSIYDDRIEVWNPGELPKQLTPAMLKSKHLSIPRNRFLAERLFYIKYIEHWGRGTNRVVEAMREEKLPDPLFEELSGGLNVTLMGPGKAFEKAIDDQKLHKLDLNDRQKKALEFIKQQGEISRKQYVDLAGISMRQANRDLKDLLIKNIIIPVGSGRGLRYKWRD